MRAVILSIGDELISGKTVDTNSAYLARQLGSMGIETLAHWTLGDDQAAIAAALTAAAAVGDVVIVSGGLGPTADDLTRQGLAEAMGTGLVLDEQRLAEIEDFFRRRGREMIAANRIQAMIPAGAQAIPNKVGTAPGIAATVGGKSVYVMPGVPYEMEWMFSNAIAPLLPRQAGVILYRIVHTFGQGESDIGTAIADLMKRDRNPTVGTTVAGGLVSVRIISRGEDERQARSLASETIAAVRLRLGKLVVGVEEQTMASVVGDLLRARGASLSVAESCTGGMIGQLVTATPGASDYYLGGLVAYANQVKIRQLGVPEDLIGRHGAVSEPVAEAMANGCRAMFQSTYALSITGIAGPAGGSEDKPVGLVYIGLAGPAGTVVFRHVLPGIRDIVRLRASLTALNHLRLCLRDRA
ncbi:MAG: competence/damage-inducible protein A [Phycisphaerae bacterium]|jgi:nicotinamide-nucleotide amidase